LEAVWLSLESGLMKGDMDEQPRSAGSRTDPFLFEQVPIVRAVADQGDTVAASCGCNCTCNPTSCGCNSYCYCNAGGCSCKMVVV
jgi:hypothetical protein